MQSLNFTSHISGRSIAQLLKRNRGLLNSRRPPSERAAKRAEEDHKSEGAQMILDGFTTRRFPTWSSAQGIDVPGPLFLQVKPVNQQSIKRSATLKLTCLSTLAQSLLAPRSPWTRSRFSHIFRIFPTASLAVMEFLERSGVGSFGHPDTWLLNKLLRCAQKPKTAIPQWHVDVRLWDNLRPKKRGETGNLDPNPCSPRLHQCTTWPVVR